MSRLKKYILLVFLFVILKFDAQEYSIKNLTIEDGLPTNIIYDIQQDEIGYLWIATEKGLVKYDGDDFILINKQKTTNLFIDKHTIYAGQENGLFVKNKSKEQFFKSKKVLSITKYKNEVYAGTIEGLYSLKQNKLIPLRLNSPLDFSTINDIISDEKALLLTSSNGLFKLHKNLKYNNLIKIKKGNFTSIDKSYSGFITAKSNNTIFEIKNDSILKTIETFSNITSIKKLKNEVWVTSRTDGIEVYALPSFSFKRKINKYNSLQTNTFYNVFRDDKNTTYIASDKGIYVLNNVTFKNTSKSKPIIYFENLQVNHQNVDSLLFSKRLKFSHKENNIAISFKTVDLSSPKKIQYRYFLNGKFSPWTTNNTVQFANLKAGRYTFEVQSKIDNQESNLKSLSFIIDASFYQKAWFIFTIVITLLLSGYFFLDHYIKRIHRTNQQKINQLKLQNRLLSLEQKALQLQMNPHFIFNVLNGIKALGNNGNTKELNSTISKFSILLRGILNNSRKEEITLHEEIILLKNYIDLEQRMSSKSFSYNISSNLNNIDAEEILIPTMLIQPFVENCIQHAFEKNTLGKIDISFTAKQRFLHCTIVDNGIGINQSQKKKSIAMHKSVALKVSKERLLLINTFSSLKITEISKDKTIKGTHISFKIPLKTDY